MFPVWESKAVNKYIAEHRWRKAQPHFTRSPEFHSPSPGGKIFNAAWHLNCTFPNQNNFTPLLSPDWRLHPHPNSQLMILFPASLRKLQQLKQHYADSWQHTYLILRLYTLRLSLLPGKNNLYFYLKPPLSYLQKSLYPTAFPLHWVTLFACTLLCSIC